MTTQDSSAPRKKDGRFSTLDIDRVGELRGHGLSWAAVAREMGYKPANLRQTYLRRTDPQFLKHARKRSARGAVKRRLRVQALMAEAKDKPCVDCGVRLPIECMELDHVRGEKKFALGHIYDGARRYRTIQEIVDEIAKCEVRCPNCHRLRHYRERLAKVPPKRRQMRLPV